MSTERFLKALDSGDLETIRIMLIEHPDYLNMSLNWDDGKRKGFLLNCAAWRNHAEVVRFLVEEKGVDIDRQMGAGSGRTALHHACIKGAEKAVAMLLKLGATPSLRDHEGHTPFDLTESAAIRKMLAEEINNSIPQLKNEKKETVWTLVSPCEVMSVRRTPDNVYRLTEIFNFEARRMTALALELKNNLLAQTVLFFDDIPDRQCLHQAHAKLLELGGKGNASSIDKILLDKPKLPRG